MAGQTCSAWFQSKCRESLHVCVCVFVLVDFWFYFVFVFHTRKNKAQLWMFPFASAASLGALSVCQCLALVCLITISIEHESSVGGARLHFDSLSLSLSLWSRTVFHFIWLCSVRCTWNEWRWPPSVCLAINLNLLTLTFIHWQTKWIFVCCSEMKWCTSALSNVLSLSVNSLFAMLSADLSVRLSFLWLARIEWRNCLAAVRCQAWKYQCSVAVGAVILHWTRDTIQLVWSTPTKELIETQETVWFQCQRECVFPFSGGKCHTTPVHFVCLHRIDDGKLKQKGPAVHQQHD